MFTRAIVAVLALLALTAGVIVFPTAFGQEEHRLVSIAELASQASHEVNAVSRTPLASPASDLFHTVPALEPEGSGRVPNYLRALATIPGSVAPYASAFQTVLYGGTIEPETKIAMALAIGRALHSRYAVVHTRRLLAATERGRALLRYMESGGEVRPQQEIALRYAEWLTGDVHGVNDERFRHVRGHYNDAQIVELTFVVSFFNYFTRFERAVHLPVESWANQPAAERPPAGGGRNPARVSLISDAQIRWAAGVVGSRQQASEDGNLGEIGLVNSQRAMYLVPDVASAWRNYTSTTGTDAVVTREIKLHVSFAVSTANGCRYCTLHQVQGLRSVGVSPAKLLQMQKDDSALTPRELAAVTFARKLTRDPASMTDGDYDRLRAEFGERGALEIVLQTCNFAFMNRFTDNLGLPSEDEAIRVYRETYGSDWSE